MSGVVDLQPAPPLRGDLHRRRVPAEGLPEPAGLRVVVVNGTSQPGLGADNAGLLNSLGYALTIPVDAIDKNELTTDVLFANGFRQEAEVLATALQIDVASVAPVPDQQFTVQLVDGDLWLMLGADRVP